MSQTINKIDMHKDIVLGLNKLYEQKNHDYGDSFGDTYRKLGPISAVTRLSDKFNRLCSLVTLNEDERKVKDESIEDTLLDLANYAIMTVIEMRLEKGIFTTVPSYAEKHGLTNTSTSADSTPKVTNVITDGTRTFTKEQMIVDRLGKIMGTDVLVRFESSHEFKECLKYFDACPQLMRSHKPFSALDIQCPIDPENGKEPEFVDNKDFAPNYGFIEFFPKIIKGYSFYQIRFSPNIERIHSSHHVVTWGHIINPDSELFDYDNNCKYKY